MKHTLTQQQLQEELDLLKAKNSELEKIIKKNNSSYKNSEEKLLQRDNYLSALNESKKILLSSSQKDGFQQFVNILGSASNASRTYIFINHTSNDGILLMSQKAEYCAVGIKPEIDNPDLQNINYDDFFERWLQTLSKGELILGKISDFPVGEKEFLEVQEIKAVLIIPIILNNTFIGFIGFDNCINEREWDKAEQNFLRSAANDLAQFIERNKVQEQLVAENIKFQRTMDALDAVVYVADLQTYELIYQNKLSNTLTGAKIGNKCYLSIQKGFTEPCSFCTNHLLLNENGEPNAPYIWEYQNTITKQWYQCRDQAIRWTDGRMARLEIAIDITKSKKAEETIKLNLERQKLISSISASFVGEFNLDMAINNLLEKIGEFSNADRSYVFLFRNDGKIMDNTNEWCAHGINPEKDNLQNQPSDIFPWWMKKLYNNEIVHIEDISRLPNEAKAEKETLESQGIKSIIEIPLNIFGKLIGFIGLDNMKSTKTWSTETIELLKISGEMLANTIHSKKTEENLQISEKNYRSLTESMDEVVVRISPTGKILYVSPSAEKFGGYIPSEEIGKHISKYVFKKIDLVRALKSLSDALIYKKSGTFQFTFKPKNKLPFQVEHSYVPLLKNGKVVAIQLVIRNINERIKSEQALIDSEERLKILFESAPDAYYLSDIKGTFLDGNKAAEDLIGYKKEELIGKSFLKLKILSVKQIIRASKILVNSVGGRGSSTGPDEFVLNRKNGSKVTVEIRTYPVKIKNKTVILGIAHDITERKKVENALIESQDRFKALSEATYEGILISRKGIIIDVNQALCDLTGYSYYDFVGSNATEFISPDYTEHVSQNMISGYDKPYKSIIIRKDGSHLHVEFQGRMFKYKDKSSRVTAVRDITVRNKNETIINESKIKLEKLNSKLVSTVKEEVKKNREKDRIMMVQSKQAAMGEMIGNIAHQWRQPLNDIGLYIQNLQDKFEYNDLTEENLTEIVNRSMDKLDYMSHTIDDFRNFFRSDKEKVQFLLSDNINRTILLTEASFKNSHIRVKLDLEENIFFNGYPNEFSQAILNILNNAKDILIENSTQNPHVHINLKEKGGIITLIISNNGGYIPTKIIDQIFDPYFTTKTNQTGTGLGLYISKTIIERNMDGKLSVRNANTNHAEFIIELFI